jgi:hypothetical protein
VWCQVAGRTLAATSILSRSCYSLISLDTQAAGGGALENIGGSRRQRVCISAKIGGSLLASPPPYVPELAV